MTGGVPGTGDYCDGPIPILFAHVSIKVLAAVLASLVFTWYVIWFKEVLAILHLPTSCKDVSRINLASSPRVHRMVIGW